MAAIGRAKPVGMIHDWQTHESNMANQVKNRAIADLNIQDKQIQLDETKRKIAAQKQQKEADIAPMPWETVSMKFMGNGEKGSPSEFITQVAAKHGLLDMSQGGAGVTSKRNNRELLGILSQPQMASKLSRKRLDYSRGKLAEAKEILAKKPNDPNAVANFQKWSDTLTQALGSDKDITAGMKALNEQKGKGFTLGQGQKRFDDKGNEVASVAPKPTNSVSEKEKSLKSIKDDFQQTIGRYYSSKRGTDQYVPSENQEEVTKEAEAQAKALALRYKELGGDVRDLGISEDMLLDGTEPEAEQERQLPNPEDYSGKIIKYKDGRRFKSDGKKWNSLNG